MTMACSEFTSLIDDYLKEQIPENKRESFEEHYFTCDACFNELKLHERLYSKEIPIILKSAKPLHIWGFRPLLILTSLFIVVISSFLVINNYKQAKYLYEISMVEPPSYARTETRDVSQDQTITRAMVLYNKQEYGKALELLDTVPDENPQAAFFKGICYLELNQLKPAVECFNSIIREMNPSYYDEAVFYKGIALLRLNEKKEALAQFQNLASMFSPYSQQAREIITKIEIK
jgi:tetratricopeptide (TPR) repeat protein